MLNNKFYHLLNLPISKKFFKYFIWWWLAALTDYLLYLYFTQILNIFFIYSAIISFCITLIFWFLFQKYITFNDKKRAHIKQWLIFLIFQLIWLLIHIEILWILVDKLWINNIIAPIFSKWVVFLWNFLMNYYFNFK